MRKSKSAKLSTLFMFVSLTAQAAPPSSLEIGTLEAAQPKKMGVYLSALGDSAPGLLSINGAFDLDSDWRLTTGFGFLTAYTLGVGLKYRFLSADFPVRPFAGINVAVLYTVILAPLSRSSAYQGNSTPFVWEFFGLTSLGIGFDWQLMSGFNLGLGCNLWASLWAPTDYSASTPSLTPFLNIGMYF